MPDLIARLHSTCPYFAMFPPEFARQAIDRWSIPGDVVLDPFSGRGTVALEALSRGRHSVVSDVNPVAVVLSASKSNIPGLQAVREVVDEMEETYRALNYANRKVLDSSKSDLPNFFSLAFHPDTLDEMMFVREWISSRFDKESMFIKAIFLGILHGEMGRSSRYLSNQMPRTISMKPDYSVRYWISRGLLPQRKMTFERFRDELNYRLSGGPVGWRGRALRSDARRLSEALPGDHGRVNLVVTSPPYFDTTSFEEDQWLRLWCLGGPPHPTYRVISPDDRHRTASRYWQFLADCWAGVAPLLAPGARLVCRLGSARLDAPALGRELVQTVRAAFPSALLYGGAVVSTPRNRQGRALGLTSRRPQEIDFVFTV